MKGVLYTLVIGLSFAHPHAFQTKLDLAPLGPAIQQTPEVNTQSAEMAEVKKLNAEVIKLYNESKFDEALPIAKRALKISEKEFGNSHRITADARSNLAELYIRKDEYDEADSNYKRALPIYEKTLGANHLLVGRTYDRLAFLRFVRRDFEKAGELYERALAIKEKALGADDEEVLLSLIKLAELYGKTRAYDKAKPLYRRVIATREKAYGQNHSKVAEVLEKYACALYSNKEQDEAEKVEARANSILYSDEAGKGEPITPPNDVFTCKIISNPYPKFPEAARSARWSGATSLRVAVLVDENGKVTSAQFLSGDKLFKATAEKGAMSAQFRPTVVDGKAVKVKGEVVYDYLTMTRMVVVPGTVRQ